MKQFWQTYRFIISLGILIVLYVVGIVGLQTSSQAWFLAATPLTLLITSGLLLLNHEKYDIYFPIFVAIVLLSGFFVEVAGVKTTIIFGEYSYGKTLGLKIFDVPLVIAFNWLLLIYATGTMLEKWQVHWALKAFSGAILLTFFDAILEPLAVEMDFWTWAYAEIPVQNFVAWFFVSFVLLVVFYRMPFPKKNQLAAPVMFIQFLFFTILHVMKF